jgi:hydroxymethylbilane synthase
MVVAALKRAWPELETAIEVIKTRGDDRKVEPLDPRAGRKGLFTGEIERALSAGEIDIAVHSAKDLPSETSPGLEVAAVLPRASVGDVLISKEGDEFALRSNAVVATGSVRRQHQLRWKQPGIEVVELRGNVPTRLRKFVESDWQAIVLARAGLERLGYDLNNRVFDFEGRKLRAEILPPDDFLPAGGQGIIALEIRSGDDHARRIVDVVNDADTFLCLKAERKFLRLLQGDCGSPIGVLATLERDEMTLQAQVFSPLDEAPRTGKVRSSLRTQPPENVSAALYAWMYGQR